MALKHIVAIVVAVGYVVGNVVLLWLYAGPEVRDHTYRFPGRDGREDTVMNVGIAVVIFGVCQTVSASFLVRRLLSAVIDDTGVPEATRGCWLFGTIGLQVACFLPAFIMALTIFACLFDRDRPWDQCLAIFSPLHFLPWIAGIALFLALAVVGAVGFPWMCWTFFRELCCPQCVARPDQATGPGSGTVEVALTTPSTGIPETIAVTVRTPLCEHLVPSDGIVTGGDDTSRV